MIVTLFIFAKRAQTPVTEFSDRKFTVSKFSGNVSSKLTASLATDIDEMAKMDSQFVKQCCRNTMATYETEPKICAIPEDGISGLIARGEVWEPTG